MTLAEYIKENITDCFAALPLSECRITKARLIEDAPHLSHAVMLAVPYPHGRGRIAAFARLPDYHLFFKSFEEAVSALVNERYGKREVRVFSDHSPIDERDAARRAGLGVIGDNDLFISDKYGSFVFLGEIIVQLDREELEREGICVRSDGGGECLRCGLCAEACPAGCIGGDKSKCVSALTQKKGDLSDAEKDIIKKGKSAWGCDVCAEVCPMNERPSVQYKDFFLHGQIAPLSFSDIEKMSDEEYKTYPFSWRRREVIERNFKIIDEGVTDR